MNRLRQKELRAGRLWSHLEELSERERLALLEDKHNPLWDVDCPLHLACWTCKQWGFPILVNYVRFWGVPLIRVHNFHRIALTKESRVAVWRYRDAWTMRWHPGALGEIEAIARHLFGEAA